MSSVLPGERTRLGRDAEAVVAEHLRARGFEIVAQNLRMGPLEIDIVARETNVVAIVEVKTRGPRAWGGAFRAIDFGKRHRLRRAGLRLWRDRYRHDTSVDRLRFDAASVCFGGAAPIIEYIRAAF